MDLREAYLHSFMESFKYSRNVRRVNAANMPTFPVDPVRVDHSTLHDPWFVFPYDRKLIAAIEQSLTEQGWTKQWEKSETDLNQSENPRQRWSKTGEEYRYPYPEFIVEFTDTVAGAVCKRREIGSISKVVPVYEFACADVNDSPRSE